MGPTPWAPWDDDDDADADADSDDKNQFVDATIPEKVTKIVLISRSRN